MWLVATDQRNSRVNSSMFQSKASGFPSSMRERRIDGKSLNELSSSIEQHGLIEPVILRPRGGAYEVVAGTRRFLAARKDRHEEDSSFSAEAKRFRGL